MRIARMRTLWAFLIFACGRARLGEKSAERKQVVCRFFYVVAEATTHKEFLAQSQNPNLFCTKRRKDSAPRELPSWFGQLRCRAEKLATRHWSLRNTCTNAKWSKRPQEVNT